MKKVLVLMLVLGMASLANAGTISLVGAGGATDIVAPAGPVTLNLVYSGNPIIGWEINLDAGSAIITGATLTAQGQNSLLDVINDLAVGGGPGVFPIYPVQALDMGATQDSGVALAAAGGIFGTITVNYDGVSTLVLTPALIAAMDTTFNDPGDITTGGVTITPEPATMLILGLGGLLLRRK